MNYNPHSFSSILILLVTVLFQGCAWFDTTKLSKDEVLITSADKRVVFKNTNGICTEPSPDVAKAMEQAFAVQLKILEQGDLGVSSSHSEAIAQLAERTVSITLLRDNMYRACESYANGAISKTSYSLLMKRNDKAMVTLMLGEAVAGAYGRTGAKIEGETESSNNFAQTGFAEDFHKALDNLNTINVEVVEAKAAKEIAKKALEDYSPPVPLTDDSATLQTKLAEDLAKADSALTLAEAKKKDAEALVQSTYNYQMAKKSKSTASGVGSITSTQVDHVSRALGDMHFYHVNSGGYDEPESVT